MRLIFIHGPVACGKLTIARALAARTGLPVFHNHLIVDAVAAVFPFGSEAFVRLRESFWLSVMAEAAAAGRSLIFTFAPEPSVAPELPRRIRSIVEQAGGDVVFVRLTVTTAEQERRLTLASRNEFAKLQSVELLRQLRDSFSACEAAMPESALTLDTTRIGADEAARAILEALKLGS